jgi:non-heme chloroperoxidase
VLAARPQAREKKEYFMNIKEAENLTVKRVAAGGTNLAYIEKGSGEPMVFIHGEVSDFRTWAEQFDAFSSDYRVISYSRRAHYPNERELFDSNYTRARHTADLIAFLKALNLEKAHLIGHSYGASIALMAAGSRPELVGSLVLGEPCPLPELFDEEGRSLSAKQKKAFDIAVRLAQIGDRKAAVREFLHIIAGIDVLPLLPEDRRAALMENAGTLLPMLRHYYDSPLNRETLSGVKIPTLLITGELSPLIARLGNKMLGRCLPNSKTAVLKGASHGLQMENPEGFHQLVTDFLATNKNTAKLARYRQLYESVFH